MISGKVDGGLKGASRHESEQAKQTERKRGRGKLTMPLYKPPVTDRETDRQTEVMASNEIEQVNRSHIRMHTVQTHTHQLGDSLNTQPPEQATERHGQTQAYLSQTQTNTLLPFDHNTSASITASELPLSPSLCS